MIRIDRRIIVTALALSVCAKASAQQPTPSCDSAVYRQLDFWVGTWDVRLDGSDTVIGTNIIVEDAHGRSTSSSSGDRSLFVSTLLRSP